MVAGRRRPGWLLAPVPIVGGHVPDGAGSVVTHAVQSRTVAGSGGDGIGRIHRSGRGQRDPSVDHQTRSPL